MRWLVVLVCMFATTTARADELRVLEQSGQSLLHEYLLSKAAEQFAARRQAVSEALHSPEAMLERRERLRTDLRQLIGDLPSRTPLNAQVVGTIQCDGYRIEKVLFESRPAHHVTANLYLPDSARGPVPGVLVPCGHSDHGKADNAYQSVCVLLALNGCAALIYDPIGQGERHQLVGPLKHGTTEHTLVGIGALLVGWNTANYRIWDGLRSMDYLASRPEVDPKRLGCTGNSGGGTMTTWLMAVDDRIQVAAPSCFITTLERLFNTIGPQDCEQHFPGQGKRGIDHADFITMRAPKPTLVLAAEQDFFDFSGTRQAAAEAAAVYRLLGHADRVDLFSYDDKHGFSRPRREAAVHWMRKWLSANDQPVHEPPLTLQTARDLQVTKHGQVIEEFSSEVTVTELANRRARELTETRRAAWNAMSSTQRTGTIKQVVGMSDDRKIGPTVKKLGTIERDGYTIEKYLLERPGEVPVPALLYLPDRGPHDVTKLAAVIHVDGNGKAAEAQPGGSCEKFVRQSRIVLALDLRGYGETADAGKNSYQNDEFRVAMLAMHIGRPLLGQRTQEVLAGFSFLREHPLVDPNAIHLAGIGRAGPVALHAAVLEPRFASLTLRASIRSWADDVVARPIEPNLMGLAVPGALMHYDLPELAAFLGDRLVIESPK